MLHRSKLLATVLLGLMSFLLSNKPGLKLVSSGRTQNRFVYRLSGIPGVNHGSWLKLLRFFDLCNFQATSILLFLDFNQSYRMLCVDRVILERKVNVV